METKMIKRNWYCPKCGKEETREPECAGGGAESPSYAQFKCECGCLFEVIGGVFG